VKSCGLSYKKSEKFALITSHSQYMITVSKACYSLYTLNCILLFFHKEQNQQVKVLFIAYITNTGSVDDDRDSLP